MDSNLILNIRFRAYLHYIQYFRIALSPLPIDQSNLPVNFLFAFGQCLECECELLFFSLIAAAKRWPVATTQGTPPPPLF